MNVVNEIKCGEQYHSDENTRHFPIVEICGKSSIIYKEQCTILLSIDSGKQVSVDGHDLIKAVKNAMNT